MLFCSLASKWGVAIPADEEVFEHARYFGSSNRILSKIRIRAKAYMKCGKFCYAAYSFLSTRDVPSLAAPFKSDSSPAVRNDRSGNAIK